MRILFLSNFFPPSRSGGYTQWCYEVSSRLAARGHQIGVLTSRHERAKAPPDEHNIYRLLHLDGDLNYYRPLRIFTTRTAQHRENLLILERIVSDFAPDVMFIWGMWALSKTLAVRAEELLPHRVAYYLSDYWPSATDMHTAYWQLPAQHWYMRTPKRILGRMALAALAHEPAREPTFEHAMCVSVRLRELLIAAGVPVQHATIIHGGTDVERFRNGRKRPAVAGRLKLLYAGQLVQHKGVHTAIQAMARLVNTPGLGQISLTVVGSGHPTYERLLHDLVEREQLAQHVTFAGPRSRDEMPSLLEEHDVLVFPSIYEEPLARITQEAMAAGLVVVGTTTGGTKELLSDGITGLTFAPEDADGLAAQVARLVAEPDLFCRLAQAGRETVFEYFTIDRMTTEIEAQLNNINCDSRDNRTAGQRQVCRPILKY